MIHHHIKLAGVERQVTENLQPLFKIVLWTFFYPCQKGVRAKLNLEAMRLENICQQPGPYRLAPGVGSPPP